jgi:WD40 repeat protein
MFLVACAADPLSFARLGLHDGSVLTVAVDARGERAASAGMDKRVTLWNLRERRQLSRNCQHPEEVACLRFAPRGPTVLTACADRQLREWNPETGAEVRHLGGHDRRIFDFAFSPDENWIFAASDDGQLRRWRRTGGAAPDVLVRDREPLHALAVSHNGKRLYLAGHERRIWPLDLAGSSPTVSPSNGWTGHREAVHCLTLRPDGNVLYSAGGDRSVRAWDLRTEKELSAWDDHPDAIFALAVWDGFVVAGGQNGHVSLWETSTGKLVGRQRLLAGVLAAAPSPHGLVVGLADGSVWLATREGTRRGESR